MSEAQQELSERALGRGYRFLNRRDRTVAEMRAHLERYESDRAAVQAAIEILMDGGYLDDARYARLFAQDKRELEQWGPDRIRRTLLERGLERELVEAVLGARDPDDELEQALTLLRRRFPSPPRERRERDRALGMLLRKGYDSELALDALAAYAREPEHPGVR
jgi:regulatory protein